MGVQKAEVEYIPVQDGTGALDRTLYEGRDVYILGFSYPLEVLREIAAAANSLMVVDHHKTGHVLPMWTRVPDEN